MSIRQYPGGVITKNPTAPTTTVAKGIWTLDQAQNYTKQGIWPRSPGAPTIGTVTISGTTASVPFTAPTDTGSAAITGYTATSSPGGITSTNTTSPLSVPGLTGGTSYTFTVVATNGAGTGPVSAVSNSVTAQVIGQQAYTTSGTYSFVVPSGVTSISMVAVGPGAQTKCNGQGGGGGALAYTNNTAVTPGETLTVTVGTGIGICANRPSKLARGGTTFVEAGSGFSDFSPTTPGARQGGGSVIVGTGGAGGGTGSTSSCPGRFGGGGGAGGYSGAGGGGAITQCASGQAGSGGGGGGGGGRSYACYSPGTGFFYVRGGGGGGGVGILGQGASGAGGTRGLGGCGGSGGGGGQSGTAVLVYQCGSCRYYDPKSGAGGLYGGGAGHDSTSASLPYSYGGGGAVRIIWPGTSRSFPSTCTGNL